MKPGKKAFFRSHDTTYVKCVVKEFGKGVTAVVTAPDGRDHTVRKNDLHAKIPKEKTDNGESN